MDIGNRAYNWGSAYTGLTVEDLLVPLQGMTETAESVAGRVPIECVEWDPADPTECVRDDFDNADLINAVEAGWGITIDDAECEEIRELREGDSGSLSYALARVISKNHTPIGWTSHGHNAEDVPVWAYGPCAPAGLMDNTELADLVADLFCLDMAALNERLFVDLDERYGEDGWTLDETDPANPVAKLEGRWAKAELPCSKDLLTITTKWGRTRTYNLEGVVVHAPETERVYVPAQAIKMMRWYGIR
jgi:alkaline phosphatase